MRESVTRAPEERAQLRELPSLQHRVEKIFADAVDCEHEQPGSVGRIGLLTVGALAQHAAFALDHHLGQLRRAATP